MPGAHNVSNALAAICATHALGVSVEGAATALARFTGIKRRFEVVGTAGGVTVIDDFAHNPDKIAATLKTLRAFPGRLLLLFQPHGFGPLRKMRAELAAAFSEGMLPDDILFMPEPVYFGGTVDRSVSSVDFVGDITARGVSAEAHATREDCANRIVSQAQAGDRVVIMGARDDTLTDFAATLLHRLQGV